MWLVFLFLFVPHQEPTDLVYVVQKVSQSYQKYLNKQSDNLPYSKSKDTPWSLLSLLKNNIIDTYPKPIDTDKFAETIYDSIEGKPFKSRCLVREVNKKFSVELISPSRPWQYYATPIERKLLYDNIKLKHEDEQIKDICNARKKERETIILELDLPKNKQVVGIGEIQFVIKDIQFLFIKDNPKVFIPKIKAEYLLLEFSINR